MLQLFVDRENELKFLEEAYKSDKAELVIIYGRRRIGKTEIINKFCENKPHIYLLCTEDSEKNNLEMFRDRFADFLGKPILKDMKIESWSQLTQRFLELLERKNKIVIAIDEFSFLININKGIVSIFQKIWDELLSKRKVMVILCGSSVGMMETEVLGYKSPLYGRRTGQWKVDEIELRHLNKFFPYNNTEDLLRTYAVVGGIPAYILEFDKNKKVFENIKEKILQKGKYLYQEVDFLLKQEFREQRTYLTILKNIAIGFNNLGKLCSATGMDKANISKYLYTLEETQIIKHILPLGKRRGGIYVITDSFFNFWLNMVSPYQAEVESGNVEGVIEIIKKDFSSYMGKMFESISEKLIHSHQFKIPINLTSIGKWWYKDKEIDLICLDESKKEVLFIECKWSNLSERAARKVLWELKEKSRFVDLKRKKEYFGLIGKTIHGKEKLKKEGFIVFDLRDLLLKKRTS